MTIMMEGNRCRMNAYRWRGDTINPQVDGEWLRDENAAISAVAGAVLRLRINVQRVNPSSSVNLAFGLWYSKNSGADTRISATGSDFRVTPSVYYETQTACLNLYLDSGNGTLIDADNGMHVTGAITELFSFPASERRFETEWNLRSVTADVETDDVFEFFLKRANGDDLEFSPLFIPTLTIVAAGAIDGIGHIGRTVRGSGEIGETVGGIGSLEAAARGSGEVAATVQGAGHIGPAVKGSGAIRPEGE